MSMEFHLHFSTGRLLLKTEEESPRFLPKIPSVSFVDYTVGLSRQE